MPKREEYLIISLNIRAGIRPSISFDENVDNIN
jgi:hypothetical protein